MVAAHWFKFHMQQFHNCISFVKPRQYYALLILLVNTISIMQKNIILVTEKQATELYANYTQIKKQIDFCSTQTEITTALYQDNLHMPVSH